MSKMGRCIKFIELLLATFTVACFSISIHAFGVVSKPNSDQALPPAPSYKLNLLSKLNFNPSTIGTLVRRGRVKRDAEAEDGRPKPNTTPRKHQLNMTDESDPLGLKSAPTDDAHNTRRDEYLARVRNGEGFLSKTYRKDEPPRLTLTTVNGTVFYFPIPCDILINLRSILAIDEEDERILLDMDFIINWLDAQILDMQFIARIDQAKFISMPQKFLDQVWMPDVYLDNLVELKKLKFMEPPIAVAFDPVVGVIQYRQRLVPNVKCGMDFHYYPADTQVCEFSLRSYSYSSADIKIQWARPLGIFFQDTSDANFDLRIGDVEELLVPEEIHYHGTNNSYHTIRFKLFAKRKLSYHLLQTYIPSVFFVVITWLCFLLPQSMVECRIGITMTTLLTLTAMFASVRESTPIVSYAKAVDIWMSVCILFIFLTLFEFSIMVWLNYYKDERDKAKELEVHLDQNEHGHEQSQQKRNKLRAALSISSVRLRRFEAAAQTIEKFALPIYSISFLCFAVVYWAWLLNAADYLRWDVDPQYNKIEEL